MTQNYKKKAKKNVICKEVLGRGELKSGYKHFFRPTSPIFQDNIPCVYIIIILVYQDI